MQVKQQNMTRYSEDERDEIKQRFLEYCEKIGFSDPTDLPKFEIVDGLPISVKRPVQSVRFDKHLTREELNTTMD